MHVQRCTLHFRTIRSVFHLWTKIFTTAYSILCVSTPSVSTSSLSVSHTYTHAHSISNPLHRIISTSILYRYFMFTVIWLEIYVLIVNSFNSSLPSNWGKLQVKLFYSSRKVDSTLLKAREKLITHLIMIVIKMMACQWRFSHCYNHSYFTWSYS